jgi:hypothetical protein
LLVAYIDVNGGSYLATWNSIPVSGDVTNLAASFLHTTTVGSATPLDMTVYCSTAGVPNGKSPGTVSVSVTFTWDHPDRTIS